MFRIAALYVICSYLVTVYLREILAVQPGIGKITHRTNSRPAVSPPLLFPGGNIFISPSPRMIQAATLSYRLHSECPKSVACTGLPIGIFQIWARETFPVESDGLHSRISKGTFNPLEMNKFV